MRFVKKGKGNYWENIEMSPV